MLARVSRVPLAQAWPRGFATTASATSTSKKTKAAGGKAQGKAAEHQPQQQQQQQQQAVFLAHERAAARFPTHQGLRGFTYEQRWTHAEFARHIDAYARGFVDLGVGAKSKVATLIAASAGSVDSLVLQLALAKIGATVVPAADVASLRASLKANDISVAIVDTPVVEQALRDVLPASLGFRPGQELQPGANKAAPALSHVLHLGSEHLPWTNRLRDVPVYGRHFSPIPDLAARVPSSSTALMVQAGSAGKPSAVTHADLAAQAGWLGSKLSLTSTDRIVLALPASHPAACATVLAAAQAGASVVLPDAVSALEAASTVSASVIVGTPTSVADATAVPSSVTRAVIFDGSVKLNNVDVVTAKLSADAKTLS